MKKRILAIILTFTMVLTLVPVFTVPASATETYTINFSSVNFGTPNAATVEIEEGGYIVLPSPAATRYANSAQNQYTGWKCNLDNKLYYTGQIYTPTANATFTAQYFGNAWSGNGQCWINIAVARWNNYSGGYVPTSYGNAGLTNVIDSANNMTPSASTSAQNFTRISTGVSFTAYDYGTVARPGDATEGAGAPSGIRFAYYVFNPAGHTSYSPTANATTVYENYAAAGCVRIYPGDTVKMVATNDTPAYRPEVTHIADNSVEVVPTTTYNFYNGCFYIYPIFEAAPVSVDYYPNDGVNTEPTAVADTLVPSCPFTRAGYNFLYWNTAPDGSGDTYLPGEVAYDGASLYAIWSTTDSAAIIYSLNGGTGNITEVVTGTLLTVISGENLSRDGFTFNNWNTRADGSGTTYYPDDEVSSTIRLFAQWKYIVYTLKFDANGGSRGNISQNYTLYFCSGGRCTANGESVGTTGWSAFSYFHNNMSRPGYTYNGLNSAPDGTGAVTIPKTFNDVPNPALWPMENTVLYAQWIENEYTTSYDANGGTGVQAPVVGGFAIANPFTAPSAIERFSHWNTATDGTGTSYAAGAPLAEDNLTLYAIWVDIIYTITYNANGGTGTMPNTVSVSAGEAVIVAACAFEREGYNFTGWNTAADGTGTSYAVGDAISADVTLYAQWEEIPVVPAEITLATGSELILDASNRFVYNITVGMTVAQFLAEFDGEYTMLAADNTVISDTSATIATGMTIALYSDNVLTDYYTVVVYGDLDGDGNVNVNDIVALRLHINAGTLTGAFLEAANADRAGGINVNDIVAIRADINGSPIYQGAFGIEE